MILHGNTPPSAWTSAGGKGASLLRLQAAGFAVPPFAVVTADSFDGNGVLAEEELRTLQNLFAGETLAVRSSASVEDGAEQSFAGQFSSLLNVAPSALGDALREVWHSAANERVTAYRAAQGSDEPMRMAVIVQRMVAATAAGVAFGIHPLTGADAVVINAVYGLGESLVNGDTTADEYTIGRDESITQKLAAERPVLTPAQINAVVGACRGLRQQWGAPQDIEFAFEEDVLWLLQARPVTAVQSGETTVWDNSNIVESYPGLTLPLTFSFIEKMYASVYRQFAGIMGVSKEVIGRNADVYDRMLGLLNGRVYYNLNSWFAALAQLPGYALNAAYMESMMGVKEPFPLPVQVPHTSKVSAYWSLVRAAVAMIQNRMGANRGRKAFIRDFEEVYKPYDSMDLHRSTLRELQDHYRRFESLMLKRWRAPLVNDFFAMIYFGVLQKVTAKWVPQEEGLHNDLVAGADDIITTEPMRQLPALAKSITETPGLSNDFVSLTPKEAIDQLAAFEAPFRLWNEYLHRWGDRSLAELKLETVTYRQSPEVLMEVVQAYVAGSIFESGERGITGQRREDAEDKLNGALRGKPLSKLLYRHVLRGARYFVSNRENLRYYRTLGFGMVRRLVLAMGQRLADSGAIAATSDVFYLSLPEMLAADGRESYLTSIDNRKKDYATYAVLALPERMITQGMPGRYLMPAQTHTTATDGTGLLQGLPCSPGVVRARVRLLTHPSEAASLQGCILATYSTDPGWVVLFPTAAAILTERGSLLSHAAIVSREMGIPCIVGIPHLMASLQDGDELLMDGATGEVRLLKEPP